MRSAVKRRIMRSVPDLKPTKNYPCAARKPWKTSVFGRYIKKLYIEYTPRLPKKPALSMPILYLFASGCTRSRPFTASRMFGLSAIARL